MSLAPNVLLQLGSGTGDYQRARLVGAIELIVDEVYPEEHLGHLPKAVETGLSPHEQVCAYAMLGAFRGRKGLNPWTWT